ncbi:9390_t:CDS:2, partial [Entrophospora sp. SA101]
NPKRAVLSESQKEKLDAYEKNDKIKQIKRLTKKAKTKVNERVQKLKEKVNAIKENFKTYILQEFESHILKHDGPVLDNATHELVAYHEDDSTADIDYKEIDKVVIAVC